MVFKEQLDVNILIRLRVLKTTHWSHMVQHENRHIQNHAETNRLTERFVPHTEWKKVGRKEEGADGDMLDDLIPLKLSRLFL